MEHLYLEVTGRCNLSCGHCPVQRRSRGSRDPDFEALIQTIAAFRNAGGEHLTFSGGEPGLRGDLPALIDAAAALGFGITVFTNGTAVRKPVLTSLRKAGGMLAVSVDGPMAEIHDGIRGSGTFVPAVDALRFAVRELGGGSVILSSVLTRQLLPHIARLFEFVVSEDVRTLYAGIFEPVAFETRHPFAPEENDLAVAVVELLDLAARQMDIRIAFSESDELLRGQAVFSTGRQQASIGKTVKLQTEGWALPGPFYYASVFRLGRPMEEGWTGVLASPVLEVLRQQATTKADATPACRSCFWAQRCRGGSLALTYATYGTWTRPCPLCRVYNATLNRAAEMEIRHALAASS